MASVLITGASRGIGLALVEAYAAEGWSVFATVRNPVGAASFPHGVRVETLEVRDPASVETLARRLEGVTLDVLINNCGVIGPARQSTGDMDFEGFLDTLAINTLGPLRVTQALRPNLRLSAEGKVAVISSYMGSMSYAKSDRVAYRVSKAGANKLTQALATDLAGELIAVAAIHPGWVRTEMGGPDADIEVERSAAGIKRVIDDLELASTGRFLAYNGRELPW